MKSEFHKTAGTCEGVIVFPETMTLAQYEAYYEARKATPAKKSELVKDWNAAKAVGAFQFQGVDLENPPLDLVIFASKSLNEYMVQYLAPKV